jgi:hypothetical protein
VNWQRTLAHWPGAPGTRFSGPVQIGIGVDSTKADGWNEGAVDVFADDSSTAAVGPYDPVGEVAPDERGVGALAPHATVIMAPASTKAADARPPADARHVGDMSVALARVVQLG